MNSVMVVIIALSIVRVSQVSLHHHYLTTLTVSVSSMIVRIYLCVDYTVALVYAPTQLTHEVGYCDVPVTGYILPYLENSGTQDFPSSYITCYGPYSGQWRVELPDTVSARYVSDIVLTINFRAASILTQRIEVYVKRAHEVGYVKLFTSTDINYVYSWIWMKHEHHLSNAYDYIDHETTIVNGTEIESQYITFRYVIINGKPEPSSQIDMFAVGLVMNYTQPDVTPHCGNGVVDAVNKEQCDGGIGCLSNCICGNGTRPTTPLSRDCEEIVDYPNGTWSVYPDRLTVTYGGLDIPDDGLMCLRQLDQTGNLDVWGKYIEMLGPFTGEFEFHLPVDARNDLDVLEFSVNYRGTDMTRQRATWYIVDRNTNSLVKLFSLFDMPYTNGWYWMKHTQRLTVPAGGAGRFINQSTGLVTIKFVVDLGKPEPAAQFDYLEMVAKRN